MRLFLMICVLGGLSRHVTSASTDSLYTVDNVQIDRQEASATQARSQAIRQAQRQALQQLLSRIKPDSFPEDSLAKMISVLSDDTIESIIEDFEIKQEKVSATRYRGVFIFHFKSDKVQQFLATHRIESNDPPTLLNTSTILIIPLQQQRGKVLLWEETNEWRQRWEEQKTSRTNTYLTPLGDLKDRTSLTSKAARQGEQGVYQSLMDRYRASYLLVTTLNQDETPPRLQLSLYSAQGLEWTEPSIALIETDTSFLWQKAVGQTIQQLETLNPANFFQRRPNIKIQCLISFTNFKDWRGIQSKFLENHLIRSYSLDRLDVNTATITLTLIADQETIIKSLRAQNFLVEAVPQRSSQTLLQIRTRETFS